jgi:antitoxin component of RelBE/YafQ-DinJ toxin-antitoxin module
MKNDKVIIIRISDDIKSKYEKLLDENGMNLSKRLKLLINEDIKKLNTEL